MSNVQTIFFVGKPASGKGTQAELLSTKTGWPILSSSAGIMDVLAQGGAISSTLREKKDAGYLLPYWMSGYVFLRYMFSLEEGRGVIFDGAFRSVGETQLIVDFLTWIERPFAVIHLMVSDEEIRSRVSIRREQSGRADDAPDAIEKRIQAYYELTDKAIDVLREKGLLIEVNGEGAIKKIHEDILAKLSLK